MKRVETEYDEHGWKLIVTKDKSEVIKIYSRSKYRHHNLHKPFYLKLRETELLKLLKLLKEIET